MNLDKYLNTHSPGYVIDILKDNHIEEYVIGNKCTKPIQEKTTKDTYYDIASLTKTYTAVLIYIAYEEHKINLQDTIYQIDSNFIKLKDITILDLLSHNQDIWTDGYLGDASTKEEFYKILYTAYVKSTIPNYVDVHYIILSTLLEKIYQKDYESLIQEKILDKLHLTHTTFHPDKDNTASNNYEQNSKIDIPPGTIHDNKARRAKELGIHTGHASIFTTANDLILFLKSFLDNSLLSKETINFMLSHNNITDWNKKYLSDYSSSNDLNIMYDDYLKKNINIKLPRTYNYMGTRYKNPITILNDVPLICSDHSISFSGFTGPMYTIDFQNKIIVVIMCNVMHNTQLSREERKNMTFEIMTEIYKKLLK